MATNELVLRSSRSDIADVTIDDSEIESITARKTHTGMGILRATVLTDTSIAGFAERKDRIDYRINGSTEWTGVLTQPDRDLRSGGKQIKAQGIAVKLEQSRPDYESITDEEVSYSSIALQDAIRDYWSRTPFSASVTDQDSEIVESGAALVDSSSTSEFESLFSPPDTKPIRIQNGQIERLQSCFVHDASGATSDVSYSGGDARNFDAPGDNETFDITVEYESTYTVATRTEVIQENDYNSYNVYVDGEQIGPDAPAATLGWEDLGSKTLTPGTYTIEIELVDLSGFEPDESALDVIAVYDSSLSYTFDNDNGGNGGYLDGPELYPTVESVDIDTLTPPQQVSAAELQTTFNDTSNGQFVKVGNGTINTANNSETVSIDFATPSDSINATLGLDGFGSRTTATPQQRFNGQIVDVADIFTDLAVLNKSDVGRADYEVIFGGSDVNGLTLKEAGQVNSNGDALTRSIFPTLEPSGEAVIYSEDLGFDIS